MSFLRNAVLSFIVLLPHVCLAQRGVPSIYRESPLVSVEAINLLAEQIDKSRLDVELRISYDFFIFVQNPEKDPARPFVAGGEIIIEVLDSTGTSVAREIQKKELLRLEMTSENSPKHSLQLMFPFILNPGTYTIITEIKDRESSRRYFDDTKRVLLKNFAVGRLTLSDVFFVESQKRGTDTSIGYRAINLGGDASFGSNFLAYFGARIADHPDSLRFTIKLSKVLGESESQYVFNIDSVASGEIVNGKALAYESNKEAITYTWKEASADRLGILIPIHGDTLDAGEYELVIAARAVGESVATTKRFNIRWMNMPRSLANVEIAFDAMEYVMKEDEYKTFRSLSIENQRTAFKEFWKAKDPTTGTAYNEVLAEYYRRVDYAIVHFNTVRVNNGLKTDRGKAFVLYGHPSRTERQLLPSSSPQEIWYYSSLNKKLVFIDDRRSGDYRLESISKIE